MSMEETHADAFTLNGIDDVRFSIRSLVLLILFAALFVNFGAGYFRVLRMRSQRLAMEELAEKNQKLLDIEQYRLETLKVESDSLRRGLAKRSQFEAMLLETFESMIAAESAIEPQPDQVSVRGIPTIEGEYGLIRKWMLHVPQGVDANIRLRFLDNTGELSTEPLDFQSQRPTHHLLEPGLHRVEFQWNRNQDGGFLDAKLLVDDKVAAEIVYIHDQLTGYSYGNYFYDQQKDVKIDEQELILVSFEPNPGTTKLQVHLVGKLDP